MKMSSVIISERSRAKDVVAAARPPVRFFSADAPVVDLYMGQLDQVRFDAEHCVTFRVLTAMHLAEYLRRPKFQHALTWVQAASRLPLSLYSWSCTSPILTSSLEIMT